MALSVARRASQVILLGLRSDGTDMRPPLWINFHPIFSGSSPLFNWLYFPKQTSFYVEKKASNRNIFCNPWMLPHFFDLFPSILLGVSVRKETHGSGRCVAGGSSKLRVQLIIGEGSESTAGVVEKQYLCCSEYTGRNNKLSENIFCYCGSAGSDNVNIRLRQSQDSR